MLDYFWFAIPFAPVQCQLFPSSLLGNWEFLLKHILLHSCPYEVVPYLFQLFNPNDQDFFFLILNLSFSVLPSCAFSTLELNTSEVMGLSFPLSN